MSMRRTWTSLKRRTEFLKVAASGLRRVTPGFILQADAGPEGGPQRVGFTASRKVGNAVARNRVKRRLRALTDEVLKGAPPTGLDIVLVGRAATLTRGFDVMVADFRQALERVRQGKPQGIKSRGAS